MVKILVNHAKEHPIYGVRVHVLRGRKEKRMQWASFELRGGAVLKREEACIVAGPKRAPHMGWEFMWMRQAQRRRNIFYQGWEFMSTIGKREQQDAKSGWAPHSHLCSLFGNTQQASAPQFLRGALIQLENALEPGVKRAPPQNYVFCFLFLPLSGWLQCRFHPIAKVLFARC